VDESQDSLQLEHVGRGSVEGYKFEPIKGYPMLHWRGKRPFSSTHFYPAQLKEVHGEEVNGWRNKIYWGDNLQVMSHLLKEFRGKIDLIYIDPPFDSKADYLQTISVRGRTSSTSRSNFEEKQYTDIWNNDEYLQFMFERIVLIRELLSPEGSFYLHCDWRTSAHLRLILDEVFGPSNVINEIIWSFNSRTMASEWFARKHNNIFFARKSSEHFFNGDAVRVPHTPDSEAQYNRVDEEGRRYKAQSGGGRTYLNPLGQPCGSVWDIQLLGSRDPERLGYPTQKPEKLIERMILASSKQDSIVADFFCGSGTTQAAAQKLGRRFIGADINLGAINLTSKRLSNLPEVREGDEDFRGAGFELYSVNNYDLFRNPVEARSLLIEALEVQPISNALYDGEKDGRMVKIMPVNRIATKADLGDLISGFDQRVFQRRQDERPNQPVEKILLVCMGHEPDLKAELELQAKPFRIDVEVVDILRDRSQLEFKRDSEAKLAIVNGELIVEQFYPMNLLQKLSIQQEQVGEWRELVDSIMVDWNYDGAVLQPAVVDVPDENDLVLGRYQVPADAGTIRVKITDLLSESWEGEIDG
jgi:site-specific DNA-methyltransferase (adenine-specific)/adenine-specific DNA-methyltransferase